MTIPRMDPAGQRATINSGVSEDELIWHFRSGWNVAALNCMDAQYAPILDGYSAYIKDHARSLKRVNDRIDRSYRANYGSRREGIQAREQKMTQVYNFFALPPARAEFCDAALEISTRAMASPDLDPAAFAASNFALLEAPFDRFFNAYEQYEQQSSSWDARYGAQYGQSQPGYVAVQRGRAGSIPVAGVSDPLETVTDMTLTETTVVDPTTGASIPVVATDGRSVSQPVVQPIPDNVGDENSPES